MKIIPAIDIMDGNVVRLYKGDPNNKTIYSDNPVEIAKKWESAGADILHVVDLDATIGSGENSTMIKEIASNVSIPLQVAGGLRSEEKISQVLDFASRAVIGTIAMQLKESEQENILGDFIQTFGNERIVISIDHIDGKIVTHGWQNNTGVDLFEATNEFVLVITFELELIFFDSNERYNALLPEFTDTAYFVPIYFANSSSNLKTLSPKINFSFCNASVAAFFISSVTSDLKLGISMLILLLLL